MKPVPPIALALALITMWLTGCQAPAYVLQVVVPPKKVPAAYDIQDRSTLVFVDDPADVLPQSQLRLELANAVATTLQDAEVVTTFASLSDFEQLRLNEPQFSTWPIDRVGREFDVEQVIYIRLASFDISDPVRTAGPRANVHVKLIDVATGERPFPTGGDDRGYPASARMPFEPDYHESPGTLTIVAQTLARKTGQQVANVFHDHKPRPVGRGFKE